MSGEGESPPTSPGRISPPTSPIYHHSPPTSPLHSQTSCESSSSSTTSPVQQGVKRKLHRTTLQRKLRRFDSSLSEDDSDGDEDNTLANNQEIFENRLTIANERNDSVNNQEVFGNSGGNEPLCSNNLEENRSCGQDAGQSDVNSESDRNNSSSEHEESGSESCYSESSDSVQGRRSSESDHSRDSSDDNPCDDSDHGNRSADTVFSLYSGASASAEEGLLSVLKLYIEGKWTKKSFDSTIKAFKKLLPQPNELPSNGRAAFKKLETLTSSCCEVPYSYCITCLKLLETYNDSCDHTEGHSKFYSFPVGDQIKHMFEQRGLASVIDSYHNHPSRKAGRLCDILDGTEYLNVKQHFPNPYDLVLLWNTDGVSMSDSSTLSLWPILATICEVPPRLRSSFIIVAGVYVGERDPDMNVFLLPYVDSLKNLCEKGVTWAHPVSKQSIISKVVAPALSADAPAKAKVLQMEQHGSMFGCVLCEQKAQKTQPIVLKNGKLRRLRRFFFKEDSERSRLRSGVRMDQLGRKAERVGNPQKGVVGNAVISQIPHLDRGLCVAAEYMHLVVLGVAKYLLLKMFRERGPWYIGDQIPEMDSFIKKSIKVPDFFNRLPKKISHIKYWKASEFRAFMLFYSLPLFKGRLPDEYYQHWLLFVSAIVILLKDSISETDLATADLMIKSFVRDIGSLYGEKCYIYNVHNLVHLTTLVKRWGPLWATSTFIFESFNGYLGEHVHGTKNLGQELINNIKISQSVAILDNIVNAGGFEHHKFSLNRNELLGKPLLKEILTYDEEQAINSCSDLGYYVLFYRACLKSKTYTTRLYDENVKRANSIIQFNSQGRNEYGTILYFLKAANATFYCLIRVYKIDQLQVLYHEATSHVVNHLLPVIESEKLIVIPVEAIVTKVAKVGNYLAIMPNPYEVHL